MKVRYGMELHQQIENALKEALREKNETKKDALRMLLSALKVKEKELRRLPNEVETQQTITTLIKQRRDSAEQYKAGARADLASKEEAEIHILEAFLPQQLSISELEALVDSAVAEAAATSRKEMGKVMKVLMPKVAGRADGKQVNELVMRRLGG
jgi:uncharacterized protein